MPPKSAILLLVLALSGCQRLPSAALRTTSAAAGAVVAREASHGNPYWTATGALAGHALAGAVQSSQEKSRQEELVLAYERGRAQGAQQAYEVLQKTQTPDKARTRSQEEPGTYTEIPLVVPRRSINGVIINESVEYLRITPR